MRSQTCTAGFCCLQGLYIGLFGSTLMDIADLTRTSTAQVTTMFTALSACSLVGAPVSNSVAKEHAVLRSFGDD